MKIFVIIAILLIALCSAFCHFAIKVLNALSDFNEAYAENAQDYEVD